MTYRFRLAYLIPLMACLISCTQAPPVIERIKGATMGTAYSILWPAQASISPAFIQQEVDQLLVEINAQMSTYDPTSELSRFNQAQPPYSQIISDPLAEVVALSLKLNKQSEGYFDISVGPIVNLWGFGPNKVLNHVPTPAEIKAARQRTGLGAVALSGNELNKSSDRYLDLSAVAKGFAVDQVATLLDALQLDSYLVEIGGEMSVKGMKSAASPWRVAVEAPDFNARRVQKIIPLKNVAMATSGDYRNYIEVDGQRYSHSIDPFTALPVQHRLASVTIIDDNCARADALATAMLVMGEEKARAFAVKHKIRAYLIVRAQQDFTEYLSPAFERWLTP